MLHRIAITCSLALLVACSATHTRMESLSVRELPLGTTKVNLEKLPQANGSGYEVARALVRRAGAREPWIQEERLVDAIEAGREPTSAELVDFLRANGLAVERAGDDLDELARAMERGGWVVLHVPQGLGARSGSFLLPLAVEERSLWFAGHAPDVWRADRARVEKALHASGTEAFVVRRAPIEPTRVALTASSGVR